MSFSKHHLPISAAVFVLMAGSAAHAYEQGDWLVRGRVINVNPDESSSNVSVNGSSVGGSGVSVDDDWTLELDITYMLHRNWGVELILGYSQHDVGAEGPLSGLGDVIDTKVLPPTLTLQYHFLPDAKFRPYVGVGVNYTNFFDEDVTGGLDVPGAKVELDDSWGLAAQVGADFSINDDWFVNVDVKYLDIDTTAKFKGLNDAVGSPGNAKVDVDIDPWVFGIGIGRRF